MRAYWWKGNTYPNLGDELTPIILRRLYGVDALHASLDDAEIACGGSLLGWVGDRSPRDTPIDPLHIVGSGFMSIDDTIDDSPNTVVHSVRGYLSKMKLGVHDTSSVTVGDPGLLVSKIARELSGSTSSGGRFGVVLHHRHSGNDSVKRRFDHLSVDFIDIRTDDLDRFAAEIKSYDGIISQSLHGLIIADSLGIPNAWLELGPIHAGGAFKFLDYFSTVGREAYRKLSGVPKDERQIVQQLWAPSSVRITQLQRSIDAAFSRALG